MAERLFAAFAVCYFSLSPTDLLVSPGKKITEGIATNPVIEPFAVLVSVPCMPWRKLNFATKLWFYGP